MLGGVIVHPLADAPAVARFYREFTATAPDELSTYLDFGTAPDGQRTIALVVCYSGPPDEAERVLGPLRAFGRPIADTVGPLPYAAMQSLFADAHPPGRLNYWKSSFLAGLSDDAIAVLIDRFAAASTSSLSLNLEHLQGAVARVDPAATAFGDRDAAYTLIVTGGWVDPADSAANVGWIRETWAALQPHAKDSVYVNYVDAGDDARTEAAYGANYARLAALKATYDPDNLFRHNQNVRPAGEPLNRTSG